MRILFITDDLPQGGAERQMVNLAGSLRELGHNVRIVQCYDHPPFFRKLLNEYGLTPELLPAATGPAGRVKSICRLIRQFLPDAVISFKEGCAMACCIARLFIPFNLIVSERNHTTATTLRDRLKFLLFRKADRIVCNSHARFSYLYKKHSHLRSRLAVITNCLQSSVGEKIENKKRPGQHGESSGDYNAREFKNVLCVGRVVPQKNPEGFIRAFAVLRNAMPSARAIWVGRHESVSYFMQIKELAKREGVDEFLTFVSPSEEIEKYYREADLLCLPSHHEGFSNVLCEAIASGTLCCASDAGDNRFILESAGASDCLFSSTKPEEMADVMMRILSLTQEQRCERAQTAQKRIIPLTSLSEMTRRYLSLMSS